MLLVCLHSFCSQKVSVLSGSLIKNECPYDVWITAALHVCSPASRIASVGGVTMCFSPWVSVSSDSSPGVVDWHRDCCLDQFVACDTCNFGVAYLLARKIKLPSPHRLGSIVPLRHSKPTRW